MNEEEFKKIIESISIRFQEVKAGIGAVNTNWKMLPKELFDIAKKLGDGVPTTGEEILKIKEKWKSQDPLIDEYGKPFVLYIPYVYNFRGHESRLPRYHVSWCFTLIEMKKAGRKARYRKKSDIENNDFKMIYGTSAKKNRSLQACKNCRNKMKNIVAPNELYYPIDDMDIVKFFSMYGKQDLKDMDNYDFPVGYPENWKDISKKTRERAGWICQECGENCIDNRHFLDVHHKNGITNANITNLEILCKKCHMNKPYHGHYKSLLQSQGIV